MAASICENNAATTFTIWRNEVEKSNHFYLKLTNFVRAVDFPSRVDFRRTNTNLPSRWFYSALWCVLHTSLQFHSYLGPTRSLTSKHWYSQYRPLPQTLITGNEVSPGFAIAQVSSQLTMLDPCQILPMYRRSGLISHSSVSTFGIKR